MAPPPSRSLPSGPGRLHKRDGSASSITSPSAVSPLTDSQAFTFNRSQTPKTTYEEPWRSQAPSRPHPPSHSHSHSHPHPMKIKPYLRKLSSKDVTHSLDLSRPAADNEALQGLGITEQRPAPDVQFPGIASRRAQHHRSVSNTSSQFSVSASSSLQRPQAPYMPPIRQTPRPYTPPISHSTPASVLGSEVEVNNIMSDDEYHLRQHAYAQDPARRSGSVSSLSMAGLTPQLRIHTTGSSSLLGASYSQSSASLSTPIGTRSRGDTNASKDMASTPSSRTSIDNAFRFIRPGGRDRDSPVDAASRAASIQAARRAFQEKEDAKRLKDESEAARLAERENRKLYKKEEQARRQSGSFERAAPMRSRSVSGDNEKSGMRPNVVRGQVPKSVWLRFIAWFKTRILRVSNRVSVKA